MKYRIRKAFLWLMMTLMVLFGVAGCGSNLTAEEKAQALQVAGEVVEAMLEAAEETETTVVEKIQIEKAAATTVAETQVEKAIATTAEKTQVENVETAAQETQDEAVAHTDELDEHGSYTSKESVAAYIHTYGHLPENYITKNEAEKLGWNSKEGNLWEVAPGMSIGGSKFGNYEGLLPDRKGRKYYECDIDYEGGYRGAKRIIYSNDGLIFYTEDHYESFEQLY